MSDVQAEQPVDASPASTEPTAPTEGQGTALAAAAEAAAAEPAAPAHPAETLLQRIEDIAILWGGDVMTELRNLVGKIRAVL